MKKRKIFNIYFSLFFTAVICSFIANDTSAIFISSGFSESIAELEKVINSINAVLKTVVNTFQFIGNIFGIKVFFLLLSVVIISSGLTAVGVSKGKIAFFTSLFISDLFWFIWVYAQKTESFSNIFSIRGLLKTHKIN